MSKELSENISANTVTGSMGVTLAANDPLVATKTGAITTEGYYGRTPNVFGTLTNFSLEFFFLYFRDDKQTHHNYLFATDSSSTKGVQLIVRSSNNQMVMNVQNNTVDLFTLENERWYHMVVTKSDNNYLCYVDGVLKATHNNMATITHNSGYYILGNWSSQNTDLYSFDGQISIFRIYNRTLTQAEVTTLYNNGNPIWASSLKDITVASYDASGITETGWTDGTGNGYMSEWYNPQIAYKINDIDGYVRIPFPWSGGTSGDNLYLYMKPPGYTQTCYVGSDENTLTSTRKKTLTFKTNVLGLSSSAQAVAELNVTQKEAVYTYEFHIASSVTGKLSAGGQNTVLSANLVTFRNGVQVSTQSVNASYSIPATPGFTLSGRTLTAANRTTVVGGDRSVEVTGEFTTSEGIKVTDVISVTQAANTATYENPVVGLDYPIIPASGGTVVPGNAAWSQVITYSSGASETKVGIGVGSYSGDGVDPKTGSVTAPSKGTTVSGLTVITTSTLTVVANGKTGSYSRDVTQAANSAELDSIEVVPNTTQAVPASGGTRTFSIRATMKYTSGSTSTSIPTTSMEFSIPTTSWASISENTLTVNNRGTEIGSSRTVVVTVKYTWGGKSVTDTYTVSQQANAEILSSVYITGTASGYTKDTVPYTGGTVVWSVTGVYTYTSDADAEKPVDASEGNWTVTGTGATQNGATTTWAQNLSEGSRSATVKFTHSDSGEIATGITTQLSQNLVVASYSDILSVYSNVKAGY